MLLQVPCLKRGLPPREWLQLLMRQIVEKQVSSGPDGAVIDGAFLWICFPPDIIPSPWWDLMASNKYCQVEWTLLWWGGISVESMFPQNPSRSLTIPKLLQIFSSGSQSPASKGGICVELLPPRCPSQPLVRPKVEQSVFESLWKLEISEEVLLLQGAFLWCYCLLDVLLHPWCEIKFNKSLPFQIVLLSWGAFLWRCCPPWVLPSLSWGL